MHQRTAVTPELLGMSRPCATIARVLGSWSSLVFPWSVNEHGGKCPESRLIQSCDTHRTVALRKSGNGRITHLPRLEFPLAPSRLLAPLHFCTLVHQVCVIEDEIGDEARDVYSVTHAISAEQLKQYVPRPHQLCLDPAVGQGGEGACMGHHSTTQRVSQ